MAEQLLAMKPWGRLWSERLQVEQSSRLGHRAQSLELERPSLLTGHPSALEANSPQQQRASL